MPQVNPEIYLRRAQKIELASGNNELEPIYLAALQKNLEALGYVLSQELAERILTLSLDQVELLYHNLIAHLQKQVGAHVDYQPMYPNFPAEVMNLSEAELYFNALWHYWGDWIGQRLMPQLSKEPRAPLSEGKPLTMIGLGTQQEFSQIFVNLVSARGSLSQTDREDLSWFVTNYGNDLLPFLPAEIPFKETLALLGARLLRDTDLAADYLPSQIQTATDILRLAVALSEGDTSLAKPACFKSLPKSQRRFLLGLLESIASPEEDMARYPERWKRLGESLHPGSYASRYPRAAAAFAAVRRGDPVRNFNSQVEAALHQGKAEQALDLLLQRPGELARRLDHLLRIIQQPAPILVGFSKVADKVSSRVLLQMMAHFSQRDHDTDLRTFFPKGDVGKVQAIENNLPLFSSELCAQVRVICEQALRSQYAQLPNLGRVYLDPELKNYAVPLSLRSASKALHTLGRGSRIPLPEGDTLRLFIWWKDGQNRTDIDLSALGLDAEHQEKLTIAYYNLKDVGAYHSGDITSAPDGASEFIDLSISNLLAAEIRFLVMVVSSFTQQPYCDLPECFAGFMLRQAPQSGEIYEPRTLENKFDLSADTTIAIPLMIDLVKREVIWTDLALKRNPAGVNNVFKNLSRLSLLSKAMQNLQPPNLYDLLALHQEARGEPVSTPAQADIVFAVDQGITPFDTERLLAEFI